MYNVTVYNVMFLPIWGEVFFVFDAAQVVSSERCRLLHGGSCFVAVGGRTCRRTWPAPI